MLGLLKYSPLKFVTFNLKAYKKRAVPTIYFEPHVFICAMSFVNKELEFEGTD